MNTQRAAQGDSLSSVDKKDATTATPVALYRIDDSGCASYFGIFRTAHAAANAVPQILSEADAGHEALVSIAARLKQAADEMEAGSLADIQVFFRIGASLLFFGWHRLPEIADQWTESIQVIAVDYEGTLSEMRMQPSVTAFRRMSAAFGMEVPHVLN